MSSSTSTATADLNALALRTTNFPPADSFTPPHTFLSLIPLTSASYPQQQYKPTPSPPSKPVASPRQTAQPSAEEIEAGGLLLGEGNLSERSSLDGAVTVKAKVETTPSASGASGLGMGTMRFLKLGPVHWGAAGDGEGDWSVVE